MKFKIGDIIVNNVYNIDIEPNYKVVNVYTLGYTPYYNLEFYYKEMSYNSSFTCDYIDQNYILSIENRTNKLKQILNDRNKV